MPHRCRHLQQSLLLDMLARELNDNVADKHGYALYGGDSDGPKVVGS